MDVKSGKLYWPAIDKQTKTYPTLKQDLECDVLIVGGGITGALICYTMSKLGIKVVLIDKNKIGTGSTSATTALIQYDSDINLFELIKLIGQDKAVANHKLCRDAIQTLKKLTQEVGAKQIFKPKQSLYLASSEADIPQLEQELKVRQKYGFKTKFLDRQTLLDRFNITAPAALLSEDAAQLDPLKLTRALMAASLKKGSQIYEQTNVTRYLHQAELVVATTASKHQITAKKVIFAPGFEAPKFLSQKVAQLESTYALATEPIPELIKPIKNLIIWETARPYLYARTTEDHRLIIGGEDEEFVDPKKRDQLIETKSQAIITKFSQYFRLDEVKVDYKWAGTFGETEDSLPYIGQSEDFKNGYFALAYGGNGIVFSVIACEIIRDLYLNKTNKNSPIYKFGR